MPAPIDGRNGVTADRRGLKRPAPHAVGFLGNLESVGQRSAKSNACPGSWAKYRFSKDSLQKMIDDRDRVWKNIGQDIQFMHVDLFNVIE